MTMASSSITATFGTCATTIRLGIPITSPRKTRGFQR